MLTLSPYLRKKLGIINVVKIYQELQIGRLIYLYKAGHLSDREHSGFSFPDPSMPVS